jgi:hypothetical protein
MARPALALVGLLGFLCGCPAAPHWSLPLADLDRVALSVAERSPHEVYVVGGALGSGGDALFLRYDGSAWQRLGVGANPTGATLWWVFVVPGSAESVYAVGENGLIVHWDGATSSQMPSGTNATLFGIWGSSDDDLWAVGGIPDTRGAILHKDATGWHDATPASNTGAYFKVWGRAANDVFVCGQLSTVLHWDGAAWKPLDTGLGGPTSLFTIAGNARGDLYAVGGASQAVVLRYAAGVFSPLGDALLANAPGLAGVAVDSDGTVLLVGTSGTMLRGRPGAFTDESAAATNYDLHAASLVAGEAFVVGGNYFAPAAVKVRHGVVGHFGGEVASTLR